MRRSGKTVHRAAFMAYANAHVATDEEIGLADDVKEALAMDRNDVYEELLPRALTSITAPPPQSIPWTADHVQRLMDRASLASGSFLRFCIDYDVPLPFLFRLWRPDKTHEMGTMIHM